MPFFSVSAIGLVVGTIGHYLRHGDHSVWRGFFGAWAGFAAGALIGLMLDVISQSGHWVPLLGHLGAVAASMLSQWLPLDASDESISGS